MENLDGIRAVQFEHDKVASEHLLIDYASEHCKIASEHR